MTRQPAASICCGLTSKGLPIGLQIIGPLYADDRVLRAARAFEATQPIRRPPLTIPVADPLPATPKLRPLPG
jgi:aspartyl-tRNA(Asn)/glutamyl-tRNA(Gln) amidotransferase subunit A